MLLLCPQGVLHVVSAPLGLSLAVHPSAPTCQLIHPHQHVNSSIRTNVPEAASNQPSEATSNHIPPHTSEATSNHTSPHTPVYNKGSDSNTVATHSAEKDNSHTILTQFSHNSHTILTQFSHNSHTILTQFSQGAFSKKHLQDGSCDIFKTTPV